MYFAGAVPYLRLKREGGALPYFTGAQLYLSGAETVEYSGIHMARREHHIIPNPNGGWDVKRNGSHTAIIHTNTKATVIEQDRILRKVKSTGFIIYRKDGMILRSERYGGQTVVAERVRADNNQRYFQYDKD